MFRISGALRGQKADLSQQILATLLRATCQVCFLYVKVCLPKCFSLSADSYNLYQSLFTSELEVDLPFYGV